jgi:hypothetical protein
MERLIAAYVPFKNIVHRKYNYMLQPWVPGWREHPIMHEATATRTSTLGCGPGKSAKKPL